jgi:hypothetical protein
MSREGRNGREVHEESFLWLPLVTFTYRWLPPHVPVRPERLARFIVNLSSVVKEQSSGAWIQFSLKFSIATMSSERCLEGAIQSRSHIL